MSLLCRPLVLTFVLIWTLHRPASAQETVNFAVPMNVTFQVTDVTRTSTATATLRFTDANLTPGHVLRISARADSIEFVGPSGDKIPASAVSWTTSNAQGGLGSNGVLSTLSDVLVFQSAVFPSSGRVDLKFTLQPAGSVHAGTHTLGLRWTVEAVIP